MTSTTSLHRKLQELNKEIHAWHATDKSGDLRLKRCWYVNQLHDVRTLNAPTESFIRFKEDCLAELERQRSAIVEQLLLQNQESS